MTVQVEGLQATVQNLRATLVVLAAELAELQQQVHNRQRAAAALPVLDHRRDLEQASAAALATLDWQLQSVRERLESLSAQDLQLVEALETTRVALNNELMQWRERQVPPVWSLAGQLAGTTVLFTMASQLADPEAAQQTLQQVAGTILAAEPELGLRVVGYGDFEGDDPEATRITTQKRAEAMKDALVRLGVPEHRLIAVGRADERRLANMDTNTNANRRVVFEPFVIEQPDS